MRICRAVVPHTEGFHKHTSDDRDVERIPDEFGRVRRTYEHVQVIIKWLIVFELIASHIAP